MCVRVCAVDQDVRYTAVSSFIFLRFFAPAILSPNLFQLRPHHPVKSTYRREYDLHREYVFFFPLIFVWICVIKDH